MGFDHTAAMQHASAIEDAHCRNRPFSFRDERRTFNEDNLEDPEWKDKEPVSEPVAVRTFVFAVTVDIYAEDKGTTSGDVMDWIKTCLDQGDRGRSDEIGVSRTEVYEIP